MSSIILSPLKKIKASSYQDEEARGATWFHRYLEPENRPSFFLVAVTGVPGQPHFGRDSGVDFEFSGHWLSPDANSL